MDVIVSQERSLYFISLVVDAEQTPCVEEYDFSPFPPLRIHLDIFKPAVKGFARVHRVKDHPYGSDSTFSLGRREVTKIGYLYCFMSHPTTNTITQKLHLPVAMDARSVVSSSSAELIA